MESKNSCILCDHRNIRWGYGSTKHYLMNPIEGMKFFKINYRK